MMADEVIPGREGWDASYTIPDGTEIGISGAMCACNVLAASESELAQRFDLTSTAILRLTSPPGMTSAVC